jgi:hypothetical protein
MKEKKIKIKRHRFCQIHAGLRFDQNCCFIKIQFCHTMCACACVCVRVRVCVCVCVCLQV